MEIETSRDSGCQKYFQVWVTYERCEETKHMKPENLAMESEPMANISDAITESFEVIKNIKEDYENSESVSSPEDDGYAVYIISERGTMIASVTVVSFDYSYETIH